MYGGLMIIGVVFSVIGWLLSANLKRKFNYYSQVPITGGLSGRQIAERMLQRYGVYDVQIVEGQGMLTDHYNPQTKTVSLSPDVYHGRSVAAAAVAAHECGHAVQHAESYSMLQVRSALVPVVQLSANLQQYLFMLGLVGLAALNNPIVLLVAIAAFGVTTLFALVTLPVEFDASRRALVWLQDTNLAVAAEYDGAKDALWWAAMTYVSAALAALVQLLYLVMLFFNNRED